MYDPRPSRMTVLAHNLLSTFKHLALHMGKVMASAGYRSMIPGMVCLRHALVSNRYAEVSGLQA